MNEETTIATKFNAPNKYVEAPFLSMFKVNINNTIEYYIQISKDEKAPEWERMSKMLEQSFKGFFKNKKFIEMVVRLFCNIKDK